LLNFSDINADFLKKKAVKIGQKLVCNQHKALLKMADLLITQQPQIISLAKNKWRRVKRPTTLLSAINDTFRTGQINDLIAEQL
jgi:hypothetical protein